MSNRPRLTEKTYTFVKQDSKWFPVRNGVIDQRCDGFKSKRAIREWQQDRELYCGEMVHVEFKPKQEHMSNLTIEDDRTEEQRQTHTLGVVARDKFMSGWGRAANGASRCAWACRDRNEADLLFKWVSDRGEMRYVNMVDLRTYRVPRGTAHFHIYVADPQYHPALRSMPEAQAWEYVNREGLEAARHSNHYRTALRHCRCGECFCCHVKRVVDGMVAGGGEVAK